MPQDKIYTQTKFNDSKLIVVLIVLILGILKCDFNIESLKSDVLPKGLSELLDISKIAKKIINEFSENNNGQIADKILMLDVEGAGEIPLNQFEKGMKILKMRLDLTRLIPQEIGETLSELLKSPFIDYSEIQHTQSALGHLQIVANAFNEQLKTAGISDRLFDVEIIEDRSGAEISFKLGPKSVIGFYYNDKGDIIAIGFEDSREQDTKPKRPAYILQTVVSGKGGKFIISANGAES